MNICWWEMQWAISIPMPGWKKAPKPEALAACSDLYIRLLVVAPNGSLSPSKLSLAIQDMHRKVAVNFSGREMVAWSDDMGALIRLGFRKLVESVPEPHRSRVLCKAALNEQTPTHTHTHTNPPIPTPTHTHTHTLTDGGANPFFSKTCKSLVDGKFS
jgi:hypothetical protein